MNPFASDVNLPGSQRRQKVRTAFRIAAKVQNGGISGSIESAVRRECHDIFRRTRLLERIIPLIEDNLLAGGLAAPTAPKNAQPPAAV